MCGIPFRWRKASKCKKLVRRVQCRLRFLKIKRRSIIQQSREDIVELLRIGKPETAFSQAEELFKDQILLGAYDLLEHFCEFVILHLPYIRKLKNCPNDINEAVSTLIFAAPRCGGDLPELQTLSKLFEERHGRKFIKEITELQPGNHVNCQVKEKLCLKSIPNNMKLSLIVELAKDPALQAQYPESNKRLGPNHLLICGNDNLDWEGYESELVCNKLPDQGSLERFGSNRPSTNSSENKVETRRTSSHSELLAQFNERTFNLDEVEEIHINTLQDHYAGEKTIFLFNSTLLSERNNYGFSGASSLVSSHCNCASCSSGSSHRMTIAPERVKKTTNDCSSRSDSCRQFQNSEGINSSSFKHVHPKLPDYDELVMKFKALKQEHQQRKAACCIDDYPLQHVTRNVQVYNGFHHP